jgi:predicted enzyme related to lactoylglutathione lyase
MTTSLSVVHIMVDDPDTALPFYRDALGLSILQDVDNGEFRWITLGNDDGPGIVLSQPHAGRSQADGDVLAALLAKGEFRPVHFKTDDLEGTFDKIASTPGAEVLQEPTKQPWGVRDGAVRDPAGNFLRIEQA